MAGAVDSQAVFAEAATRVGFGPTHLAQLLAAELDTLAKLAFSCAFTPGAADDRPLQDLQQAVFGAAGPVSPGVAAMFRRLHFEAFAIASADLRVRLDPSPDQAPRRLPTAERAVRQARQQQQLQGMTLTGELEPAHCLVDSACQALEDGVLGYIPWEQCLTRTQELLGVRRDAALRVDGQGGLRLVPGSIAATASLATDLGVYQALTRRGLAYDLACVMSYSTHDFWVQKLFRHLQAPAPPGYAPTSMAQLQRADRALFERVGEQTRSGIRADATGQLPVDVGFMLTMQEADISFHLLPLPLRSAPAKVPAARQPAHPQQQQAQQQQPAAKAPGTGGKNSKGKGSGQPPPANQPTKKLKTNYNGHPNKLNGNPICYGFNNPPGCQGQVTGGKCSRGLHVCMSCHSTSHGFAACPTP